MSEVIAENIRKLRDNFPETVARIEALAVDGMLQAIHWLDWDRTDCGYDGPEPYSTGDFYYRADVLALFTPEGYDAFQQREKHFELHTLQSMGVSDSPGFVSFDYCPDEACVAARGVFDGIRR